MTSVDGFKDLKSRSPCACPPDPGRIASHSVQSKINGRKIYTVKLHCVPSTAHTAAEKEYEQARKGLQQSLLATRLSCVSRAGQSGRDSSGTEKHFRLITTYQDAKSDKSGGFNSDLTELCGGHKKTERGDRERREIHFATQASREQAWLRWCRQPTAVRVWESKHEPENARALPRQSSRDLSRITKQTGQPSTAISKRVTIFFLQQSPTVTSHNREPPPMPGPNKHYTVVLFNTTPPKVLDSHLNKTKAENIRELSCTAEEMSWMYNKPEKKKQILHKEGWAQVYLFFPLNPIASSIQSQTESLLHILWILSATTTGFSLRILAAASAL